MKILAFSKHWFVKHYVQFIFWTIFIVLLFIPDNWGFIPDFLGIADLTNPSDLFLLMIGTIGSIFGIVLAIILLTFETSKEYFLRKNEKNLFNQPLVKNSILNSIHLIIVNTLSFISIKEFHTTPNLTIGYLLLIFFVSYLIAIYPVSKKILTNADNLSISVQQISTFTIQDLTSGSRYKKDSSEKLNEIFETLNNYISKNDKRGCIDILIALTTKAIEFIGDGENRENCDNILSSLIKIWKSTFTEIEKQNFTEVHIYIWDNIHSIYINASKKKHFLLHYQELHSFLFLEYITHLKKHKNINALEKAFYVLKSSFQYNLFNNCPNEDIIKDLYDLFDRSKSDEIESNWQQDIQWDYIINILTDLMNTKRAILDLEDIEVHRDLNRELKTLMRSVNNTLKLGNLQKRYIIQTCVMDSCYHATEFIKEHQKYTVSELIEIDKSLFNELIEDEQNYVLVLLSKYSDLLVNAQRLQITDYNHFGLLHTVSTVAFKSSRQQVSNKTAKNFIKYYIRILKHLKKEIENQLPSQAKRYNEILRNLQNLKRILAENNHDITLQEKLDGIIGKFRKVDEQEDFGIIKLKKKFYR